MRRILLGAVLCGLVMTASAEFADYRFIPPAKNALAIGAAAKTVAATAASKMAGGAVPHYQIEDYAGQTGAPEQTAKAQALQVGEGAELGWVSADLFDAPEKSDGLYVWRAAIRSVDAAALRLRLNLDRLHPEDEVWVVDPVGTGAFGPYTLADATDHGRWLPTTMGDTAVLVLQSPQAVMPDVTVEALSHLYQTPATKQLDCPLSADCTENTTLREVSTGIGRMTVSDDRGTTFLCSGALLNNAVTEVAEGLFLTADHCFQGTPGTIFADGIEVIWDLRTNGCPGTEPTEGEIATLPRSTGVAFLLNSTGFDAMLLELDSAPVGALGRAYLGWDTRAPRIGDACVGLHHPAANRATTAMKECIGQVHEVEVSTRFGQLQTTISWDEGITEGGSSGSPVMFDDDHFRVFGMLSNGNNQSCDPGSTRLDQYSSFREFFAIAGGFLNQATPPDAGRNTYSSTDDGTGGCRMQEQSLASSAGNVLLSGLALLTLLGMGALGRNRP